MRVLDSRWMDSRIVETISHVDLLFLRWCLSHRFHNQTAQVSKAVSHTGDGHLYVLIGLAAWWVDETIGQAFLFTGLAAFAIELPIYWILKNSFRRRRPSEYSPETTSYITPSDRYSLPSGHTAAAFLMAFLIHHFYPSISTLAFVWAGLIGTSRILLAVHFVTDVFIGALLGLSCAYIAISVI